MAESLRRSLPLALTLLAFPAVAPAVVIHGFVTDPFGRPVPFARIQLIQGQRSIAIAISGPDGAYEMRSSASGRFVLLTVSSTYAPGIGTDFYGGLTTQMTQDIVLDPASIRPPFSLAATGTPTPLQRLSSPVEITLADGFRTRPGVLDELSLAPGTFVVQTGQTGGPASLLLRGGAGDANKYVVDGITAGSPGGHFALGSFASTAVGDVEILRSLASDLFGSDAQAGVVAIRTARGATLHPVLDYSGEAGKLHSWRDEVLLSGTRQKYDYLAGYSRYDTSNALSLDRFHASTSVANLGYSLATNTQLRFTLRNADTATGTPGPYQLFDLATAGRDAHQEIFSGLTVENRVAGNWHTVLRYGIARRREQIFDFYPVGQPLASAGGTIYFGNPVDLRGGNGYRVTGRAVVDFGGPHPSRQDWAADRDELTFQEDYPLSRRFHGLFGFRYENERGEVISPLAGIEDHPRRRNFGYTLQFQGDILHRVFYTAGGGLEKNHLTGIMGSPRIGLVYVPVRPGGRWMRGTSIHTSAATGFSEPALEDEATSLYATLQRTGNATALSQYGVEPVTSPRSRSFDLGVDQNILRQKLIFRATYFHQQFSHQFDRLDGGTQFALFGIARTNGQPWAGVNSGAFRAQGLETKLEYQPKPRLFLRGGYTYLASLVERSFAASFVNPALPGIAIGPSYALVGTRPFQRPAHTGFFAVQYTGRTFTGAIQGTLASRSDDSTFQAAGDLQGGNSLLLPNRDLDFGYGKLDANFTYAIARHLTLFTQFDNLLDQQHIGPVGYPGLPFTVRSGVKIRIGGD